MGFSTLCRNVLSAFAISVLTLFTLQAKASHSVGADLSYTCLGSNQYRITLNFYRDCDGIAAPTSTSVTIRSASCNRNLSLNLPRTSFSRVNTICPQQANQTTCSGGNLPGIEQHIYSAVITLPAQCADWVIGYDLCCRNSAITNLNTPGSQDLYVEARLNNAGGLCNNSPFFTTQPVPYVCSNQLTYYNHGAIDIDGDSLTYTLVNPLNNPGTNIPYRPTFSPTNPMRTIAGFGFTSSTGQMAFNANPNQNAVVTVLVREYRNGVLIGSTMRDIQIVVLNCNNNPPDMTGVNGSSASSPANFTTRVCTGVPLCFTVNFSDVDPNQQITVNWNSGIPGASFTVSNTQPPVGTFCWTPTLNDVGVHNFTVTAKDNACPIFGQQIRAYTVTVAPANYSLAFNTVNLTCPGGANGSATVIATGAVSPTYQWSWNNATTQTISNIPGGTYRVTVTDVGGCGTVDSVVVTEPPPIDINITTTPAQCNGAQNGTATVAISGGTSAAGNYNYTWSIPPPNVNIPTISNLAWGWYEVTATDDRGCIGVDSAFVFQPGPLVINAVASSTSNYNGADISCTGRSDGEISAVVSGGTLPYFYQWSPNGGGQTDSVLNGMPAGFYSVTITDNNGCNTGTSASLVDPPPLTSTAAITSDFNGLDISCFGANDGAAVVNATGGTGAYTYNWGPLSGNQNTAIAQNLGPGSYTVTVSDANGCTSTNTLVLAEPAQLTVNATAITNYHGFNITCFGYSDGRAMANVTGGHPGYTYRWDDFNNQTTDIAYDIPVGTYNVVVTDSNGCTATSSVSLNEPPVLTAVATITSNYNGSNVSCFGATDGTAGVVAAGGAAPYTYNWYPANQSTAAVTGLDANTMHVVAVSDLNECYAYDTVVLTEPTEVIPTLTVTSNYNGQQISCFGARDGQATPAASGGTPGYFYTWSSNACPCIAGFPVGLGAETYTVTATDLNGCTGTATVSLTEPTQLIANPTVTSNYNGQQISCFNAADGAATAIGIGGNGGYTYEWSNGDLTQNTSGLAAANYDVTVTDNNNCTATASLIISQPALLVASAVVSSDYNGADISCFGLSDGEATATATGGTPGYTYLWNNFTAQNTPVATGLDANSYGVIITDLNNCTATASVLLSQPPAVAVGANIVSNYNGEQVSCNGLSDGSASAVANGGVGGFTYNWTPGNQSTATATGLAANTLYTVRATDLNGCEATDDVTLTEPTPVVAAASVISDYNGRHISCFALSDGEAAASATGGVPPYTFVWNPNATVIGGTFGAMAINMHSGRYNVTATDQNGCEALTYVDLVDPPELALTTAVTSDYNGEDISCYNGSDGIAEVTSLNGGTVPYRYQWDFNAHSSQAAVAPNLSAGTYNVTITDINNCQKDTTVTLTEPTEVTLGVDPTDVSCFGLSDGSVSTVADGGIPGYVYAWSANAGGGSGSGVSGLAAGTYEITVNDLNGCTTTKTVEITEPPLLVLALTAKNPTCFNGDDGTVTSLITGGVPSYRYSWNGGPWGNEAVATGVLTGMQVLEMRDDHDCMVKDSVWISEPSPVSTDVTPPSDTIRFGDTITLVSTYETSVSGPVSYSWEPSESLTCSDCATPVASPLVATTYTLTFADANGCTAKKEAVVFVELEKPLDVPNIFTPDGNTHNDFFRPYAKGLKEFNMKIFDRWGSLVYTTNDINMGWDGTYKGELLPPDVFVYYITVMYLDGHTKSAKGSVTLIR